VLITPLGPLLVAHLPGAYFPLSASHPSNVMHNPWSGLLPPMAEVVLVTFLLHEQTNVCLSISECYTYTLPFPTSFLFDLPKHATAPILTLPWTDLP
jgi:hypothetical protein